MIEQYTLLTDLAACKPISIKQTLWNEGVNED
jgi:hypothetical protein